MILLLVFGQIQGGFNTLGTIIGESAVNFGFSSDDASLFGALFIVGGIIGSAVFGVWVEFTQNYKISVILICLLSCLFGVAQYFLFPRGTDAYWYVTIACFFQGFSMVPIMAVAFDFGVEITYPIGESYSTGVLMSSGQLFGIIYTVSSSVLIDKYDTLEEAKGSKISYIIVSVAAGFALLLSFLLKQDLKRHQFEK